MIKHGSDSFGEQIMIKKHYENVIIGGGIVGAGIFRDLCLHNQEAIIIDKNDFTSQTSQRSSKMLHGGIRYLENFDFKLIYEALHEKIYWTKLLPHLAYEVPFILPVYKESKHNKLMIKVALMLYDFLSGFNNSPHQMLSKDEVINKIEQIKQDGLLGAGLYYDSVMDDSKITLEVIYDAVTRSKGKSQAINYHSLTNVAQKTNQQILTIKNMLTGQDITISCKNIIYALGPFTDKVLGNIYPKQWDPILYPSKGSHLWVDKSKLKINHPMVINHQDGRVIFFIPREKKVLVGTTEVDEKGDIQNPEPSEEEINYLMEITNSYFPEASISRKDIISKYAGIRPLIRENEGLDKGKTARTHKTYMLGKNTFIIAGGKYTTFRVMGQSITKNIVTRAGGNYSTKRSLTPLASPSIVKNHIKWTPNEGDLQRIIEKEMPKTPEDVFERRIGVSSELEWQSLYPEHDYALFYNHVKKILEDRR